MDEFDRLRRRLAELEAENVELQRQALDARRGEYDRARLGQLMIGLGLQHRQAVLLSAFLAAPGVMLSHERVAALAAANADPDRNIASVQLSELRRRVREVCGLRVVQAVQPLGYVLPREQARALEAWLAENAPAPAVADRILRVRTKR